MPHFENDVHLLAQDTYVNVHIGNKNTQFAVFCIYPTSKEKGADIHCITAFFMLTTRFTFLMTISPISIERYNQYCLHNMPSVFCLLIETTKQPLRRECIDKRTRINLTHDSGNAADVAPCDHGIHDIAPFLFVTAFRCPDGRPMVAGLMDRLADLFPLVRHNEQRFLLIIAVQHMEGLGRSILKYDRIQRLIPSEEAACSQENDCIEAQNQVKAVHPAFLRQINGNKVRSPGRGIDAQTHGDHKAVDQTAKNTDQQRVIREGNGRDQVGKKTCKQDHFAGKERELLSDISKSDVDRKGVEENVHQRVGDFHSQELLSDPLDQNGQAGRSAGIQASCANKCLNSFQKLMATVRLRFGQDAVDTLNAYYIDGVPAATIAKCHGISPKNLIHLFEPWLKCAYKVRERVPFPAFPVSNEEAVKDSAILLIREARHYDYYTTQRNSLQQKLNTINHQFEPKSPSLTNNGGAIVHDPARVEKAILDAMEKKDNLAKQIAYYTAMIAWIEECVSRMELRSIRGFTTGRFRPV